MVIEPISFDDISHSAIPIALRVASTTGPFDNRLLVYSTFMSEPTRAIPHKLLNNYGKVAYYVICVIKWS